MKYIYYSLAFVAAFSSTVSGLAPSHIRPASTPEASASAVSAVCSPNAVQCCTTTSASNNPQVAQMYSALGLTQPGSAIDVGLNCTSIADQEVSEGSCGQLLFCCQNIYNGTSFPGYDGTKYTANNFSNNFGTNCTDVES
ncbi:hypothetical protein PNOK_0947100 [Pyrrhoderma noxium]|uniref:Hydrophobin n=1 Tax=Pyrrhoderma noxium TaxID=2282107 RepID=A0A286U5R1_9AGAM|nr:hypothetical protein PNOK_0947100 [Pyrrhoderma noxium]